VDVQTPARFGPQDYLLEFNPPCLVRYMRSSTWMQVCLALGCKFVWHSFGGWGWGGGGGVVVVLGYGLGPGCV
jgi:hypothetical protein